ncbi:CsbD family protein [Parvibaculum sp.]|uniref:CsbD family protein n=1 Tax=Parvibaculum sp. TaxID=2024848 RepID=UPI001D6945CD|nr:CsbD family protein [Parvibaculum sp.]MBX3488621.1 CsbD family protein [Parvibaculum sp.]MCW5727496.1 CsbD family protein [Parvibaculum sp.]
MDKDRIKGTAKQAKGAVKETVGKMTGDEKLEAEGKVDKAEGKIQGAYGDAKDKARDAVNDATDKVRDTVGGN